MGSGISTTNTTNQNNPNTMTNIASSSNSSHKHSNSRTPPHNHRPNLSSFQFFPSAKSLFHIHSDSSDNEDCEPKEKKLESFRVFKNEKINFQPKSLVVSVANVTGSGKNTPTHSSMRSLIQSPDSRIVDETNAQELMDKLFDIKKSESMPQLPSPFKTVKSNYNLSITNEQDNIVHQFTIQPFDYSSLANEIQSDKLSQFHEIYLPKSNIPVVHEKGEDEDDDDECCNIASYDYKHVCTLCKLQFDTEFTFEDHINLSKIHMVKLLEYRKRKNENAR